MALARDSALTLTRLLERAEAPEALKDFLINDLQITTVGDLRGYVTRIYLFGDGGWPVLSIEHRALKANSLIMVHHPRSSTAKPQLQAS